MVTIEVLLGGMMGVLSGRKATVQVQKTHRYLRAHSSYKEALPYTPAFHLLVDVPEKPANRVALHPPFHQKPDPRTTLGHKKYTFKETWRDVSPTWRAL